MFQIHFICISFMAVVSASPLGFMGGIAEDYRFDGLDNHLPKNDDGSIYPYATNPFGNENMILTIRNPEKIKNGQEIFTTNTKQANSSYRLPTNASSNVINADNGTSAYNDTDSVLIYGSNSSLIDTATNASLLYGNISNEEIETSRLPRQELNDTRSDPEFESQEESSEEEGNMVTGLLSAFLGGFSRPDGSIDLEAIVGLLGSLSTQNDDGTYDFQGLTDLLRGFFGGGGDEGGGSDIGSFLGGLLGAVIKGVANPPGSKGAGIFTGKVVTGILPALSAPPPPADEMNMGNKPQGLDSGGFLTGLLKTVLSSSSGGNEQGGGGGSNLFKIIFQLISSVFSASSKSN